MAEQIYSLADGPPKASDPPLPQGAAGREVLGYSELAVTASTPRPGYRPGYRFAASELLEQPALLARACALGFAVLFAGAKLAVVGIAIGEGFVHGLGWRSVAYAGVWAQDALAVIVLALLLGAGANVARTRITRIAFIACVVLLSAAVAFLTFLGIGFYYYYQLPLTVGQLMLAGDLRDLAAAFGDHVGALVLSGVGIAAFLAALPLLVPVARRLQWSTLRERRTWVTAAAVTMVGCSVLLAPREGLSGLDSNPVLRLLGGLRTTGAVAMVAPANMADAPHYSNARIFDPVDAPEPPGPLHEASAVGAVRNVVLVVLESAAASFYGPYGGRPGITPAFDAMAEHGLLVENAYAITPVSMKSLFSISCSSNPYAHPRSITYVNPNIKCGDLATILTDRGYRAGLFHAGTFRYTSKDLYFGHRGYEVYYDAKTLPNRGRFRATGWGIDDRAMLEAAQKWLSTVPSTTPFLLTLIPVEPHYPYHPIAGFKYPLSARSPREHYENGLFFVDTLLGQLRATLEASGRWDDTLVVVVGDHGEAFGEHPGHKMHGSYIYDEAMRVPLLFHNKRLFPTPRRTTRVSNHLDILPTMLDLLGLPADERHQGVSVVGAYKPHTIYFYSRFAHYQLGLRDGRWKYIRDMDTGNEELFDLLADPGEKNNLRAAYPDRVATYAERVLGWEAYYHELIPNYERYVLGDTACGGAPECWLDVLEPTFSSGEWSRGKTTRNKAMSVGGERYSHGYSMFAPAILRFSVNGLGYNTLTGSVGKDDDIAAFQLAETVSAEIYVDDVLVFSTGKMRKGDPIKHFVIPISGASIVELFGYDADGLDYRDIINWVDVRLVR